MKNSKAKNLEGKSNGKKVKNKEPVAQSDTVNGPIDKTGDNGVTAIESIKLWDPFFQKDAIKEFLWIDLKRLTVKIIGAPYHAINFKDSFLEMGFTSPKFSGFAELLAEYFEIDLNPSAFFGCTSLDSLGEYLLAEFLPRFQKFYQVKVSNDSQYTSRTALKPSIPQKSKVVDTMGVDSGDDADPIAIIGMSGRFPGARNIEEMWQVLVTGKDMVGEIPADRFDWDEIYDPSGDSKGKSVSKWLGSLPGPDEFDNQFFQISPREAEGMDPRQRLLLQESYKALEDAGYGPKKIEERHIGMFVGVDQVDFELANETENNITSFNNAVLAARLSYFLNLFGPNMAINTTCSSGLVAAHQAILSLRQNECDTAVIAGVNLILTPEAFVRRSHMGMLSPDGRCAAFDSAANGIALGEAIVAVVVKRLSLAEADGDPIYAVIEGSGINYDGKTNGLTAPNRVSQGNLIKSVYDRFKVDPEGIDYVVAHGTGTKLGDSVEINALNDAFGKFTDKREYCAVTSAKTNFGHALAASGLLSLVCLVQAMRHGIIPASLHCKKESDYFNWAESPFYVNTVNRNWETQPGKQRRGAISAFGISGTNAHFVLAEHKPTLAGGPAIRKPSHYLLTLSARDKPCLEEKIKEMADYLSRREITPEELLSISYTLLDGRQHFEFRCALVVKDAGEALGAMGKALQGQGPANIWFGNMPSGQAPMESINEEVVNLGRSIELDPDKFQEYLNSLAGLYCGGYDLQPNLVFGNEKPCIAHLPGYSFARTRFPIHGSRRFTKSLAESGKFAQTAVRQDESKALEYRYSTKLDLNEFFPDEPTDDDLSGLPGVAFLEMARAASGKGMGGHISPGTAVALRDVRWAMPAKINRGGDIFNISLFPEPSGETFFEIYGQKGPKGSDPIVFSHGTIGVNPGGGSLSLDLGGWRSRLSQPGEELAASAQPMRLIESLGIGEGFALAKIQVPENLADSLGRHMIYPTVLNAAIRVAEYLVWRDAALPIVAPVSLDELLAFRQFPKSVWLLVRQARGAGGLSSPAKVDLDFCDDDGIVSASLRGLSIARLNGEQSGKGVSAHGAGYSAGQALAKSSSQPAHVSPQMMADHISTMVRDGIAKALNMKVSEIHNDRSFSEYGLDSVLGRTLLESLDGQLSVKLDKTILINFNNVNGLCRQIIQEHEAEVVASMGIHIPENADEAGGAGLPQSLGRRSRGESVANPGSLAAAVGEGAPGSGGSREKIAIIGMSGRFGPANNLDEMWDILAKGIDVTEKVTRWDLSKYYPRAGNQCESGGFLNDIDHFDNFFFNITGLEAAYMDPQQRLFLEESWNALEDAGYVGDRLRGRNCGVFVGCSAGDYTQLFAGDPPAQAYWGNASSIIPARIAYFLDLTGPAVAIDTACSSSLVAIHLACQSLWAKETDMALAGGVFVQSTPELYLNANRAGMLSKTGHCHTFDAAADGFVPGEGLGAIVLKPLDAAIRDGDQVYGVISGSGINQDGTSNGITAPNAKSQERLERSVYDNFNINPAEIQLVEAHGTGTILGDPIEYDALTKSFRNYTEAKEYCAIGSVKTNIGHTITAAGIAGVLKILLSLKNKKIPPSLHFCAGNPNIKFEGSPFYVNTRLRDWEAKGDQTRRAAISSFGFSGTNSHMVIEEAPLTAKARVEKPGYIVVLSARTPEQLRQQAQGLLRHCAREQSIDCLNLSYTLMIGRRHFGNRLACVVRNQGELTALLGKWLETGSVAQVYVSAARDGAQREQPTLRKYGNDSIQTCAGTADAVEYLETLSGIAELYVQGYALDYQKLFPEQGSSIIPLPTYPLSKDRCWVPENPAKTRINAEPSAAGTLHPLLHSNESDFSEQRFASTFTGSEFFLKDHIVKGRQVLPGVAYLEMARAAVAKALGQADDEPETLVCLHGVVWIRPITRDDGDKTVNIRLSPLEDGDIAFEVYVSSGAGNAGDLVHCQGRATLLARTSAPAHDLTAVQRDCNSRGISKADCYDKFKRQGFDYGPAHQGIEKIDYGKNSLLAKLSLPSSVAATKGQFYLHPSLMDSALQAATEISGLQEGSAMGNSDDGTRLVLPFAVQEIEIWGKCSAEMWVVVRHSDSWKPGDKVEKIDLDLCDETGKICVRFKKYTFRALDGEIPAGTSLDRTFKATDNLSLVGDLVLAPVWDALSPPAPVNDQSGDDRVLVISMDSAMDQLFSAYFPSAAFLAADGSESVSEFSERIGKSGAIDHFVWVAPPAAPSLPEDAPLMADQSKGVLLCLRFIKALIGLGYQAKETKLTVLTTQCLPVDLNDPVNPTHASIHGFIGSLAKEYPHWRLRLADIGAVEIPPLSELFGFPLDRRAHSLVYRKGAWHKQQLLPCLQAAAGHSGFRRDGLYVIIGGAGDVGQVLTDYLARLYNARVVWLGRRPLDASIKSKLGSLGKTGPAPEYMEVDAGDQQAFGMAISEIKRRHGKISGVIHSAMYFSIHGVAEIEELEFIKGLSSKIDVCASLAKVLASEELDFILFFSSIIAFIKNAGQSHYAAACAFADSFARNFAKESRSPVKIMNWGYWGAGETKASESPDVLSQIGIGLIGQSEAMEALEKLMSGPLDQLGLMKITKPLAVEGMSQDEVIKIAEGRTLREKRLTETKAPAVPKKAAVADAISRQPVTAPSDQSVDGLREKTAQFLKRLIGETFKIEPNSIDSHEALEKYGIDSILVVQCTNVLAGLFPSVTSTLLFEYQTIDELAGHFIESEKETLLPLLGVSASEPEPTQAPAPAAALPETTEPAAYPANAGGLPSRAAIKEKTADFLKKLVGESFKIPFASIDSQEALEKYGIDSILVVQFTNVLAELFPSTTSTLLFEYQTIDALADHFIDAEMPRLLPLIGVSETASADSGRRAEAPLPANQEAAVPTLGFRSRFAKPARQAQGERDNETPVALGSATLPDVAIIGVSGRFAKANNLAQFWENLRNGLNCITEIPADRWDWRDYYGEERGELGTIYTKYGGFIDDVDKFDAAFFNIAPKDAEMMDPQERVFLEVAYESIEDAGYSPLNLCESRKVGVFAGAMNADYPVAAKYWSIANRVSYLMNFRGPSMTVDTACSSSLTAVHLALESIYGGMSEMAIAGGVSLTLDPKHFLYLSQWTMLSSTDECKAFGDHGDGFVSGEGVGAVVLKLLPKAIADNDHIYGVIKGSMHNSGGKTNGFTVPNPHAQYELVAEALKRARVNARAISYVEAHGTGTALGDPIEISGLTRAYEQDTKERQYCAIGSAKSNIGHCESAAGIAGLLKVVLQLKHRQIVPSLHSRDLNPLINFKNTPFVVQQGLTEWKRPVIAVNGEQKEFPRIAGLSSFGAGGSNAHLIIQEFIPAAGASPARDHSKRNPALFVLSAKNEQRLDELSLRMARALSGGQVDEAEFLDMAYTLQVGRAAMDERLAVIAESIPDLTRKLTDFHEGKEHIDGLFRGNTKHGKAALAALKDDDDMGRTIEAWIAKKKFAKIAEIWVKGLTIDWKKLYGDYLPKRISLPTYPFARDRHWLTDGDIKLINKKVSAISTLIHPLVHQNTSDFTRQSFSTVLSGKEFFLRDHVINGDKILPGVAYLEMAKKAAELALGGQPAGSAAVRVGLKNVNWERPISVNGDPVRLGISLSIDDRNEISFSISTGGEADQDSVHCKGSAFVAAPAETPRLNIGEQLGRTWNRVIAKGKCYDHFDGLGFRYGQTHRGIESLRVSDGEILAKIHAPTSAADSVKDFTIHPAIMDAVLQATYGFRIGTGQAGAMVPYFIEEIQVNAPCTATMWASVKKSGGDAQNRFDIEAYDESGNPCVSIYGLTLRELPAEQVTETVLIEPFWKQADSEDASAAAEYQNETVFLCELPDSALSGVSPDKTEAQLIALDSRESIAEISGRYQAYFAFIVAYIQKIMVEKFEGKILIRLVTQSQGDGALMSGLSAALQTAALENPRILWQSIQADAIETSEELSGLLQKCRAGGLNGKVKIERGTMYRSVYREIAAENREPGHPWKDGGIYLITGGLGGLGRIFAQDIAGKAKSPVLYLTGRAPLDQVKQEWMAGLGASGATLRYVQADISEKPEAEALLAEIKATHGRLTGVLHCAGVLRDGLIYNKAIEKSRDVFKPKIDGLINLDLGSGDLGPELFILFSSIAGTLGNVGQCDYAAANAFMDRYASYRNGAGARHCRYVSVNWPLWKDGGMNVDSGNEILVMKNRGIEPLRTEQGVMSLYRVISGSHNQAMVLEGNGFKIRESLINAKAALPPAPKTAYADAVLKPGTLTASTEGPTGPQADQSAVTQNQLLRHVAELIKAKVESIDVETELSEYGFDSITFTGFANLLNKEYGLELNPTIFFEHPTIASFSKYLNAEYPKLFMAQPATAKAAEPAPLPIMSEPSRGNGTQASLVSRFSGAKPASQTGHGSVSGLGKPEPIAIVGMSGIFPQADSISQFWENLVSGQDCITEIPADRWDWRKLYGNPHEDGNKTNIKWGGFINKVYDFDPLFFGISPREAEIMDPQQRLLMMYVWKAIEDAGYDPLSLAESKTGIFVGTANSGYEKILSSAGTEIEGYTATAFVPSIGPNRMSYFLNVHGPSEPIETACSSSLVAIHRAVNALADGSCDMAVAGGINTILTPDYHISFSKSGMLCEDGKCKTFSDKANGYVRGEGVGMLFLKKLSAAEADGDAIYGLIRGSAENHGGRASSLTAPNPKAQRDVLVEAYARAGIDPRTVGYIETHGTGTTLGDPIEINALKMAFGADAGQPAGDRGSFCGLGSVKSNIGHLELSAGVVGVIKVLLQMKHRTLVKTLHCETVNPYIKLEGSPFYLVRENHPWEAGKDSSGNDLPRRAGVSSFGFGGVNAHVVLEEYVGRKAGYPAADLAGPPALIVLSAKSPQRLRESVASLATEIKKSKFDDGDLPRIAYTLQLGRSAWEERLAFTVTSVEDLRMKLGSYLVTGTGGSDLYSGTAESRNGPTTREEGENLAKTIRSLIENREYQALLRLWVTGAQVDWSQLYRGEKIQRINLPTYNFSGKQFKVEPKPAARGLARGTSALTPLLHENVSNFAEQKFRSVFTGGEFFLSDHMVKGQRVLPAVAYLDMVRSAIEIGMGSAIGQKWELAFKNVVWLSPVVIGAEPVPLCVSIAPRADKLIEFKVQGEGAEPDQAVYFEGLAAIMPEEPEATLDLGKLRGQAWGQRISPEECYAHFESLGLSYGFGFRGIQSILAGGGVALADINIPGHLAEGADSFYLHPSVLDSAFQASIGLMIGQRGSGEAPIPFAADEIRVKAPTGKSMQSLVRRDGASSGPKYDIELCDMAGKVCLRVSGLSVKDTHAGGQRELLRLAPSIVEEGLVPETGGMAYASRLVFLFEASQELAAKLKAASTECEYVVLEAQSGDESIVDRYVRYAKILVATLKGIIQDKPDSPVLLQGLVFGDGERALFGGLDAIFKTARIENPMLIGQMLMFSGDANDAQILAALDSEVRFGSDSPVYYRDGKRYIEELREMPAADTVAQIPWQEGGVYLITGGMGGLGRLVAQEITRAISKSTIVLCGRKHLDPGQESALAEMGGDNASIEYQPVDLGDLESVRRLADHVNGKHGAVTGIIHCAGVLRDSLLLQKTEEEIEAVFLPKVRGLINLELSFGDGKPDFMILFSSVAARFGNQGQSDYGAANGFMDAYARLRNQNGQSQDGHTRILSVNWPLWREGGMQIGVEREQILLEQSGLVPLETQAAFQALGAGLEAAGGQMTVLQGNPAAIRHKFLGRRDEAHASSRPAAMAAGQAESAADSENAVKYLRQLLSETLKHPASQIDPAAPLERYGIDSIMVLRLTNQLERVFGPLSKTLFFEYSNIRGLAGYFLRNHREKLAGVIGGLGSGPVAPGASIVTGNSAPRSAFFDLHKNRFSVGEPVAAVTDIAIIGLAGRYPGANSVGEFWENLKHGVDSITEIPNDRWDWRQFFEEDKSAKGKSFSKWGGFIDGVDEFDPLFFNISPRDAEIIDPQERIFLECAYKTIEDAGYTRSNIIATDDPTKGKKVGVFVGVMYEEYQLFAAQEQKLGHNVAVNGSPASIANRVSYFCNFNGPSMAIDTMCSSSLTAIHLACQSIKNGECEAAIAGGVNISIHPNKYILLSQGKFVSSKGKCESFGKGGDGYVPGEGVGAVLLKPLAKAIADNDHIYGIIKGSMVNAGGKTNGYTVPSPVLQGEVIREAFARSRVNPRDISYIEAHGTGTVLGDPIEISGLAKAFSAYTQDKQFCAIGSVKSNIGHCESAAGIAGITKLLLQLGHGQLVPSLHSGELNENIDFSQTPFTVQQNLADWESDRPRIAGISSFGAGGSNAHIVVQEYVTDGDGQGRDPMHSSQPALIVLSAKDITALKANAKELLAALGGDRLTDRQLADIAYTLQVGREPMDERLAFTASSIDEIGAKLRAFLHGTDPAAELYRGTAKRETEVLSLAALDEDIQGAVESWVVKGKYGMLLDFWVKGMEFDWNKLYAKRPKRVSLPGYCFAKEKYWVAAAPVPGGAALVPSQRLAKTKILLTKDWIPQTPRAAGPEPRGTVLVLATGPVSDWAKNLFRDAGLGVVCATHGPKPAAGGLIGDFLSAEDGERLYRDFRSTLGEGYFAGLLDLTALDQDYEESIEVEAGKLALIQKLISEYRETGFRIMQVTYRLAAFQNGKPTLRGARSAGLYRSLNAEYRKIGSVSMDLDDLGQPLLARRVESEFMAITAESLGECCFRGETRYEPRMLPANADQVIVPTPRFGESDVVIITGGTRGIGSAVAEQAVRQGLRHLVVMGRESLPDQSAWESLSQTAAGTGMPQKLAKMNSLVRQGVKLKYFNADLADSAGLTEILREIRRDFGPVTGVFHCAGSISENPVFFKKEMGSIRSVCQPKMAGLVTLDRVLSSEPLQFFVMFSSISSLAPALAVGQLDYAMANGFMDYYAARQNAGTGKAYVSIQWPAWAETGMISDILGNQLPMYNAMGLYSISNREGFGLLDQARGLAGPVFTPCVVDSRFAAQSFLKKPNPPTREKPAARLSAPLSGKRPPAADKSIQDWIKSVMVAELKLTEQQVNIDKPFDEYGVDSILMAQIGQAIQKQLNRKLSPSLILEYPTISRLSKYFSENHADELRELLKLGVAEEATGPFGEMPEPDLTDLSGQWPIGEYQGDAAGEGDIAIVGLACRYPGAPTKEAYWELLTGGVSAIGLLPPGRWPSSENRDDYGGWLADFEMFDSDFFKIKDVDAAIMDPQARILLEESLKAIADAGYDYAGLSGQNIGVFVGGRARGDLDYQAILRANNPILGVGQNYLATNISRFFNFRGQSVVLDTACSSGLTALSMASDLLRSRKIGMAMVGAVNLLHHPFVHDFFDARNILSKDGQFHIFDRRAGGEVFGEGAGVLLAKRLGDAVRDGNKIYAVIKSIALNNDGRTLGPGSPNLAAQTEVIQKSLRDSGKTALDIGYIEVNGSGSPITDSIEIKALNESYGLDDANQKPCAIGSVKPNIGHLLLGSGLAGFIRCVLSLHHKKIPPFLSGEEKVDYFDFKASRAQFNRQTVDWVVEPGRTRVAAQNSFPDGGTNCHAIIEEFVEPADYRQRLVSQPGPTLQQKRFEVRANPSEAGVNQPAPANGHSPSLEEIKKKYSVQKAGEASGPNGKQSVNFWGNYNE